MTTLEWTLVGLAGTVLAAVLGALLTRPAWDVARRPTGTPRFATVLLGLHAGGTVVVGTVLAAAALQSWQRHGDDPSASTASSALLEVGSIDGDQRLYALFLLFIVATTVVATTLLTLAARSSLRTDTGARALASAVLGLEVGVCGYALARVLGGNRSAVYLLGVAHLPVVMAAMVACWPTYHRRSPADADSGAVRVPWFDR